MNSATDFHTLNSGSRDCNPPASGRALVSRGLAAANFSAANSLPLSRAAEGWVVGFHRLGGLFPNTIKTNSFINGILIVVAFGLLGGCVTGCVNVRDNVPSTRFTAVINGRPCTFDGPKDLKADLIRFEAATNGTITLTISNISANLNPEVITMTGEAFTKMQDANTRLVEKLSGGLGNLAGAAATAK